MKNLTYRPFPPTFLISLTASLLAMVPTALAQSNAVYTPTNLAGAGLSYIVPDTMIWYGQTNHLTIGPVVVGDQLGNNSSWEEYSGCLGDSAFLIGHMGYAQIGDATTNTTPSDGGENPIADQAYYVTVVPTDGSKPRYFSGFYDDFGHAFTNEISQRENGNPFHVTGDKRYGGTNYMVGGEGAPCEWNGGNTNGGFPYATNFFNSDGRWNNVSAWAPKGLAQTQGMESPNGDGAATFANGQVFGVNPYNWAQGPTATCKIFDVEFTPNPAIAAIYTPNNNQQVARWGGDLACLSDGNFVFGVEDRSGAFGGAGQNSMIGVVRPDGTFVSNTFLLAPKNFWNGVAAFKGGFCVRVGSFNAGDFTSGNYPDVLVPDTNGESGDAFLFFFDNNCVCYATNAMVASAHLGFNNLGRGDGTVMTSDIRSHYVYYADVLTTNNIPNTGLAYTAGVVAIWDGDTGEFVTYATWSDFTTNQFPKFDRNGIGVDALDRFCVCSDVQFDPTLPLCMYQNTARCGKFDGTNITFTTPMFFPFVNHETTTTNEMGTNMVGIETSIVPYVMMNTKEICISTKCWANSSNNPAAGDDTFSWECDGTGSQYPNPAPGDCYPTPDQSAGTGNDDRTYIYAVFAAPGPVAAPKPQMSVVTTNNTATISYPADDGLFTLQSATSISGPWADVTPQPARTPEPTFEDPDTFQFTVSAPSGPAVFYRLAR